MNRRWLLPIAAVLVALLIGGVAYSESSPTDKDAARAKLSKLETAFMTRLAKELGVSPAKLRDAIRSAGGATLDDAVRQGLLSREQAAFLKGRLADEKLELGFGPGSFKHHFGHSRFKRSHVAGLHALLMNAEARTAMASAFAKQLGLTREGLARALGERQDLEELIEAKGLTEKDIGSAVAAAAKPFVDRLVRAGTIERAEAGALTARLAEGAWLGKLLRLSLFTR
jgi:hypothetical protein